MIEIVSGDIFESGAEALVCPCNCVGVMGKGLALEFKRRFPEMFRHYKFDCDHGNISIGTAGFFRVNGSLFSEGGRWIITLPTKNHWKHPSRIEWIASGIDALIFLIGHLGLKSVAVPALGCGLGQLEWGDVSRVMLEKFAEIEDTVNIFMYRP